MVKSKNKKDSEFIPPDGGWGWMIVFAAGFSNLSALPMLQQFGLLFRDKFTRLGITNSETTTIININSALTSCVGYGISSSANALALNTYWKNKRRLATGLSWSTTGLGPVVWPHIITGLSAAFGETGTVLIISGFALHSVACALLLQPVEWHSKSPSANEQNEKELITPIPRMVNSTSNKKDEENGYFSQVSKIRNRSLFSSQYLYNEDDPITPGYEITDPGVPMMLRANDGYFSRSRQSRSRMSSSEGSAKTSRLNSKKPSLSNLLDNNRSRKSSTLYLNESKKNSSINLGALEREIKQTNKLKRKTSVTFNTQIPESEIEDCPTLKAPQDLKADEIAEVQNIDPKIVKCIADRAEKHLAGTKNLKSFKMDGQYSEKYHNDNRSIISLKNQDELYDRKYLKDNHSNQSYRTKHSRKSNNFNYETEVLKEASLKLELYLKETEDRYQADKLKLLRNSPSEDIVLRDKKEEDDVYREEKEENKEETECNLTFWQKVCMFFDLDLLKDLTFINLMLGITFANFNELNFSLLTPFILGDFGMTKSQVALFMSLLAGVDICVRFCIPFVAGKIGWNNNSFFLLGVMLMATGRVVLAYCQDYTVVLTVAVIVGFGKGLRTVFMALVIPTHVPLHKLPGATGLQLLTAGIVYFTLGPIVGWIKDSASTAVTLHCLNIFTWLTAISWGLEKFLTSRKNKVEDELYKL